MDKEEEDPLVTKLQEETFKLKTTYANTWEDLQWFPQSEKIASCGDEDFPAILKSLSFKELEVAALCVQRYIDIEEETLKCLELNLNVASDNNGDHLEVTQKVIVSQERLARLRSRLLRCTAEQLHQRGGVPFQLTKWVGIHIPKTAPAGTNQGTPPVNQPMEETHPTVVSAEETSSTCTEVTSKVNMESSREEEEERTDEVPQKAVPPPKPKPYGEPEKPKPEEAGSVGKDDSSVGEDDTDGMVLLENPGTQNWNPIPLLKVLLDDSKSKQEAEAPISAAISLVTMEGYMEKLPVGKAKKTLGFSSGWKRRHFKAVRGNLNYYTDHKQVEPLGSINLVGSTVTLVNEKMLEITEQSEGGKTLKLRCATVPETLDWKSALEEESQQNEDQAEEEAADVEGATIVIDLGSSVVKAGFAQEEAWPQVVFPCVCAIDNEDSEKCTYGYDAFLPEIRRNSTLRFPLRKSLKIDKLKFDTAELLGILEFTFNQLKVDPSKHKVIMTLPQNAAQAEKEEFVDILLSTFQVEACYLQEQAILAMYSYSAVSGIIVDIGNHIDIIPVVEGCMIESGAARLPYGGRQITDSLARLLTEKGHRFFSEVESYVTRLIKEKTCYVLEQKLTEDDDPTSPESVSLTVNIEKYALPDGTSSVTLDTARYRATEGLFQPRLWGKDNAGVHELTHKAIMACGIDVRKQMCRNIYLSGGGSMLPGFAERLQMEVSSLVDSKSHVQVHAGLDRNYAAFIGASVLAKLPLFDEMCVSQEDWDLDGTDALEKWQSQ